IVHNRRTRRSIAAAGDPDLGARRRVPYDSDVQLSPFPTAAMMSDTQPAGARKLAAVFGVLCWLALLPAHAADLRFPAESRIGLARPPGMKMTAAFTGFEDPDNRAVIIFTELSIAAYYDVVKELDVGDLKAGGIEVEAREDVWLRDGRGFLMVARQANLRRW